MLSSGPVITLKLLTHNDLRLVQPNLSLPRFIDHAGRSSKHVWRFKCAEALTAECSDAELLFRAEQLRAEGKPEKWAHLILLIFELIQSVC